MIDLGASLTRLAAEKGLSQTALAERVGITQRRMAHYFNGARRPDYELLIKIAGVLGVDLYELLGAEDLAKGLISRRMGEIIARYYTPTAGVSDETLRSLRGEIQPETALRLIGGASAESDLSAAQEGEPQPAADAFAHVPLHDVELAAGTGAQNDTEAAGSYLLFRQDWLRRIGVSPRDARLARVRGDSMLPLLSDRDVVLLDTSKTDVPPRRAIPTDRRRAHLVAVDHEGEARIKWAERPDAASLVLFSENSALFGPEIFLSAEAERIRIIGHVVWWGHTVRD